MPTLLFQRARAALATSSALKLNTEQLMARRQLLWMWSDIRFRLDEARELGAGEVIDTLETMRDDVRELLG